MKAPKTAFVGTAEPTSQLEDALRFACPADSRTEAEARSVFPQAPIAPLKFPNVEHTTIAVSLDSKIG